jgi:hypothetical protein
MGKSGSKEKSCKVSSAGQEGLTLGAYFFAIIDETAKEVPG